MRQASFRCLTCHAIISNTSIGTKHRNHCPLCLWSKHLDLKTPGDRRSSCGARMKPVGLTLKKDGELMIVHLCLNCGKISCNRIAGDDNSYSIVQLMNAPIKLDTELIAKLCSSNINLISQEEEPLALTAIFGYDYESHLK